MKQPIPFTFEGVTYRSKSAACKANGISPVSPWSRGLDKTMPSYEERFAYCVDRFRKTGAYAYEKSVTPNNLKDNKPLVDGNVSLPDTMEAEPVINKVFNYEPHDDEIVIKIKLPKSIMRFIASASH